MTQLDVAREVEVGQQTVGRWENGDVPQRRHWARIAEFLGLGAEAEVRAILEADQAGGNVVHLPGSERLADVRATSSQHQALVAAITERVKMDGKLSDAEVAFFRDLLEIPEARA
jgi:DNA-binding XRE family transcriptional regulator